MSQQRLTIRLAATLALTCAAWTAAVQAQQPAPQRPASPPVSRMGVIDAQQAPAGPSYFTIVGAVRQSGVYHASSPWIPIEQLVDAAGGLNPDASFTFRVVRNQEVRFQVAFDPERPDPANRILPGDVVIVQQEYAGSAANIVPVVCLGLIERPVVLPLDASIRTVNDLSRCLLQNDNVARMARVLNHTADSTGVLASGAVVVFPTQYVDRVPLQQPGAFPDSLDLHQQRTSAAPGLVSGQMQLPPPAPPVMSVDVIVAATAPRDSAIPTRHVLPAPGVELEASLDTEVPAGSSTMLVNAEEARDLFSVDAPLPPPSTAPLLPPSTESTRPQPQKAIVLTPIATPIITEELPSTAQITQVAKSQTVHLEEELEMAEAISAAPAFDWQRSISLIVGAGILIVSSIIVAMLWSYWQKQEMLAASQAISSPAPAIASVREQIAAPARDLPAGPIQELLQRTVPVIEEQVVVPSQWPLHGVVIGHRRIILNSAHDSVPAPHFARRAAAAQNSTVAAGNGRKRSNSTDERQLRTTLRAAMESTHSPTSELPLGESDDLVRSAGPHPQADAKRPTYPTASRPVEKPLDVAARPSPVPAPHAFSSERISAGDGSRDYDIVQPQQTPPVAMSPLERALRTLALEKRG
ncbi:polysaccharide biosynthesis/export family protein [Planctomicrobium piriforme]|uniref:SLBB domain-containing protein n=1 Tax=Planctomicrobium piriforme TaxID=1576369 RepID=A0A1I3NCQ5_9PLAN|nr:hypothetical protein [Planctomicrobium piriforme]SFJ06955.1 hypothetical protein SAMN05421753_11560 [Planctomicrobium piriforme]